MAPHDRKQLIILSFNKLINEKCFARLGFKISSGVHVPWQIYTMLMPLHIVGLGEMRVPPGRGLYATLGSDVFILEMSKMYYPLIQLSVGMQIYQEGLEMLFSIALSTNFFLVLRSSKATFGNILPIVIIVHGTVQTMSVV